MYKIKNIIQNINFFVVSDKHLVYKQNDNIIFKNKILEKEVKDDIILTGDNIFYNKGNGFIARKLINNNKAHFDNYAILNIKPMYLQKGIIIDINDNQLYLFDKFNFNKEKINIIDYNWGIIFLSQEYILINDINKISSYHIPTAHPLWQFDLSQLAPPKFYSALFEKEDYKVEKIIGILDDKVWVALNNYTLIALDIHTGKLVYQLSEIPGFDYAFGNIIPAPKSMKIDKKRNLLYGLAWEYYWEIDPQTGKIQMWDLHDYILSLKLRNDLILNYVKIDDVIYFASRPVSPHESQIAGFDVNTKKIVWQHKFTPGKNGKIPMINDVKGSEKLLAVLDMEHNLYVFEREEMQNT